MSCIKRTARRTQYKTLVNKLVKLGSLPKVQMKPCKTLHISDVYITRSQLCTMSSSRTEMAKQKKAHWAKF